jgi:hypothetical protein
MHGGRAALSRGEGGFSRFELVTATTLMGVLGTIVLFSLSSAAAGGERASCASDVAAVDTAATAYSAEHPLITQLTVGELTAKGTGTLSSWPPSPNHTYVIMIAGNGNTLVGTLDVRGITIERNDILVRIANRLYDSTRSFATACSSA